MAKIKTVARAKYTEDDYLDMLRDCYGDVEVCGMTMDAATVLKECDPVAFRCGFADHQEYETVYICNDCGAEHDEREDALICCETQDEVD